MMTCLICLQPSSHFKDKTYVKHHKERSWYSWCMLELVGWMLCWFVIYKPTYLHKNNFLYIWQNHNQSTFCLIYHGPNQTTPTGSTTTNEDVAWSAIAQTRSFSLPELCIAVLWHLIKEQRHMQYDGVWARLSCSFPCLQEGWAWHALPRVSCEVHQCFVWMSIYRSTKTPVLSPATLPCKCLLQCMVEQVGVVVMIAVFM